MLCSLFELLRYAWVAHLVHLDFSLNSAHNVYTYLKLPQGAAHKVFEHHNIESVYNTNLQTTLTTPAELQAAHLTEMYLVVDMVKLYPGLQSGLRAHDATDFFEGQFEDVSFRIKLDLP